MISCIFNWWTHIDELVSDSQFMDQSLVRGEKNLFNSVYSLCQYLQPFFAALYKNIQRNMYKTLELTNSRNFIL